ncbi:MAG: MFS transporter [Endomicrobiaceae bacterium]|nr:MFS transporter [Endomicrobiaceae bacterium]
MSTTGFDSVKEIQPQTNAKQKSKGLKLFSLSLAHGLNDWYTNYLQTLLPFFVAAGFSISKSAVLISAFTISSSILQPFFAYLVDKKNKRWMVYVGTIWMGTLLSLIGLIGNYTLLFITVTLAGFGTAAFHPQASAMVTSISGNKKGLYQSIFVTAGNIGLAFTPLIIVPFVKTYGLKATPLFIIPALLVGILLWITSPKMEAKKQVIDHSTLEALKQNWKSLTKIVITVSLRSLAFFGLISFLPLYLKGKDISITVSSHLLFIMLFSGAIGGLIGGSLSDKFGRKPIIAYSLMLATPFFCGFLLTGGILSTLFLALAGMALLASFSVTVVSAQEILTKSQAMASGLMLGFGIGIGGIGVSIIGLLAEHVGLNYAIYLLVALPFFAGSFYAVKAKSNIKPVI